MNQVKLTKVLSELFKNDDCVFVEKPAGLLMYWTMGVKDTEFMLQIVRDQMGKMIYPVQRLDRGTSGIVGFGLSKAGATVLQKTLQSHTTRKYYITLVRGRLEGEGEIDQPLRSPKRGVQSALTLYRVLEAGQYCSLVQVEILTGRFHQIRKHMSLIGHPIIGDFVDGKSKTNNLYREKYGLSRPFLHAARLDFEKNDKFPSVVVSGLPADLLTPYKKIAEEFGFSSESAKMVSEPIELCQFDDHKRKHLSSGQ